MTGIHARCVQRAFFYPRRDVRRTHHETRRAKHHLLVRIRRTRCYVRETLINGPTSEVAGEM
ncbi:hypothetical protein ACSHSS_28895, partial [Burkholderia sp. BC1]